MRAIIWDWRKIGPEGTFYISHGKPEEKLAAMYLAADKGYFAKYDIEASDCEEVFEKLNLHHPADYQNRSLSTGDLIIDNSANVWICESFGWKNLETYRDEFPGVIHTIMGAING